VIRGHEELALLQHVVAGITVERDPQGAIAAGDAPARGVLDGVDLAVGEGDGGWHGVSPVAFADGINILAVTARLKR
jgi:hypothetical protein